MTKITKETLAAKIELLEGYAGSLSISEEYQPEAYRMLLAGMEQEPVAWLWSNRKHKSEVTLTSPENDEKAEAAQWSGWSVQALCMVPEFRETLDSSTKHFRENAETSTNPPVIPDGWVKCSDRMPDETQPVIVVADGGVVQRTVYQFCEGVWCDWYEQYDDVNVDVFTHWMPLPAAPQQEVKS